MEGGREGSREGGRERGEKIENGRKFGVDMCIMWTHLCRHACV